MLVLTRKPGEQIIIAGNIKVSVVSIGQGRVKIGIEAPSDVTIDRQEVFEKRLSEQLPQLPSVPELETNGTTLHNRILDKLPPASEEVQTPITVQRENRVKIEHRFPPRKSR